MDACTASDLCFWVLEDKFRDNYWVTDIIVKTIYQAGDEHVTLDDFIIIIEIQDKTYNVGYKEVPVYYEENIEMNKAKKKTMNRATWKEVWKGSMKLNPHEWKTTP